MGLFLKKKEEEKEEHLPPPPPPAPPAEGVVGDIEPIRPREEFEAPMPKEMPNLAIPEITAEEEAVVEVEEEAPEPPKEFVPPRMPEHFEPEEREEVKGPVFVSVSDYERIELDINSIRTLLNEAEDNLKVLNQTVEEEDKLFKKWRSFLEGVEKKLSFVDKIISKTGE